MIESRVQTPTVDVNNNNNISPRVNNDNNNGNGPTRVLRPRQTLNIEKYLWGTRVCKIFGEVGRLKEYRGYIAGFDKKEGYYKVKYEDGDVEEYWEDEITTVVHK